jgi:hypothetical protein
MACPQLRDDDFRAGRVLEAVGGAAGGTASADAGGDGGGAGGWDATFGTDAGRATTEGDASPSCSGATCTVNEPPRCSSFGGGACAGSACAPGACEDCPVDGDVDADGVCDAVDLERRSFVAGVTRPSLSSDGATLFAVSADLRELHAFAVQTSPVVGLTLIDAVIVATGTRRIQEVFALDATRAAVTLRDTTTDDIRWIQVYARQGMSLALVVDIDTTTNRIYAVDYDARSDRLYWSNYLRPAVYFYPLATTPTGFVGLGNPAAPVTRVGGYGIHLDTDRLFKLSADVEVADLNSGAIIASWVLPAGAGGAIGQNVVSVFDDAILYTTYFGDDVRFVIEDVSELPAHSLVSSVLLAPAGNVEAHFVLRTPAAVALVACAGQPLLLFDLTTLPAPPPSPIQLPAAALDGDRAVGFLDCGAAACFVAAETGIHVLAP